MVPFLLTNFSRFLKWYLLLDTKFSPLKPPRWIWNKMLKGGLIFLGLKGFKGNCPPTLDNLLLWTCLHCGILPLWTLLLRTHHAFTQFFELVGPRHSVVLSRRALFKSISLLLLNQLIVYKTHCLKQEGAIFPYYSQFVFLLSRSNGKQGLNCIRNLLNMLI